MRRTASDRVGELAGVCTDPQEAEHQMREAIKWGLEQNKRTIRMMKLERLWKWSLFTFYQGICLPFPVCWRLAGFYLELVFGREDGKGRVGGK